MWNWTRAAVICFPFLSVAFLALSAAPVLAVTAAEGSTGAPRPVPLTGFARLQQALNLYDKADTSGSPELMIWSAIPQAPRFTSGVSAPDLIAAELTGPDLGRRQGLTAAPEEKRRPVNDFLRFADASLYTWSGPVRWDGKDWLKLGGTIAGSALLALADQQVRDFSQRRDGAAWDAIETAGFHYGKPYAAFALTGGFYLSGIIFKSEWARETGLILGSAFLTSATVQTIMKTAVGRARPGTNVGNWAFKPFSSLPDYHSFPSGHMQVALATALVLSRRLEHPLLKAFFYAAAGTTFISRMHSDAHWISDLAFGGAISWFCAETVIKRMEYNKLNAPFRKKQNISWELTPSASGIALTGKF